MRINFDLDGVLYQWDKTARYMLREILPGSPYSKNGPLGKQSTDWHYIQQNVQPEHWDWLWKEGVALGLFRHGHMFPGAIKIVRQLAQLGEIFIVTHRPKQAVPDTLAWLAYQQLPISGVHILTNGEPKSSVVTEGIFIDDKPDNVHDVDRVHSDAVTTYLMRRPWNAGINWIRTVESLAEFGACVYNHRIQEVGP
jgi:5'(3')-deoxyribonucleotidase